MIHRNDRTRFGQSVALNESKTESVPECFELWRNKCTSGNNTPELPAECRMNASIFPPLLCDEGQSSAGRRQRKGESSLDFIAQVLNDVWDGYEHRDSMTPNRRNDRC